MKTLAVLLLLSSPALADAPSVACRLAAQRSILAFDGASDDAWAAAVDDMKRAGVVDCAKGLLGGRLTAVESRIAGEKNRGEAGLLRDRAACARKRLAALPNVWRAAPQKMANRRSVLIYCGRHDPARGKRPGKAIVSGCGKDVVLAAYHCVEACPK